MSKILITSKEMSDITRMLELEIIPNVGDKIVLEGIDNPVTIIEKVYWQADNHWVLFVE